MEEGYRVATVGTFDGVHKGHREVLRTLCQYATAHQMRPMVITFDRHPLATVDPDRAPGMLQSREARDEMLRSSGVEVEEVEFTPEVCRLTAREWMKILRDRYGVKALVTGYDNKFGSDGRGMEADQYIELGKELSIDVVVAPELPGVCSSAIRKAVARGEMGSATEMLGRPFSLTGKVEAGRHLGRCLGFPTANVGIPTGIQMPPTGVYAGKLDGKAAVINIGDNPTVSEGNPVTVEAHVIDYDGNLYGREVTVEFIRRIREERKFGSLEELTRQIGIDTDQARKILEKY